MLLLILKSSTCLAVFMLFYKLCLEKTSAHNFKRFYLLAVIFISAAIPFITFTEYIFIEPVNVSSNKEIVNFSNINFTETIQTKDYLPTILWCIYGLGVLVFSIRFFKNLYQLIIKINQNPKYKYRNFINVLLEDLVTPHTFFNYIFLNKVKFKNQEIPFEVLLHEQTHAKQKHALDVLFIEILQILFWFNPLLYFIKKDIKLNHEFLADRTVIHSGYNTQNYQKLLLAFSSSASHSSLANAFNYSLIKKRFTVMKTKTSKPALWLRSFFLLPILGVLIYGFSTTKQIRKDKTIKTSDQETTNNSNYSPSKYTARSISIEVFSDGTYEIDNTKATRNTFVKVINHLHKDITPEIRNKIINIHLKSQEEISNKEVWFIYNSLKDYGFYRIVAPNQEINREKGNTPFAIQSNLSNQQKASVKQVTEYNKLAKHSNSQLESEFPIIKVKDVKRIEYLYGIMSEDQKKNAESYPDFSKVPPPPKIDIINSYISLTKRTKFIPNNRRNNMRRLKELYNKMSKLQKEKIENPNSINEYIKKLDDLSATQIEKVNKVYTKIKARAKSKGRKFYTASEYNELEKLYTSILQDRK